MSLFYSFAYLLGFTPWEKVAMHRPAAEQIAAIFDREEAERRPPFGKALDLGCGTGLWAIELARRGWDVTGIDLVAGAIRKARGRARNAGVNVQFTQGDVTDLPATGIGSGFRFIWDFGMVHGFNEAQRVSVAKALTAVSAPDATMVMLAWTPANRGPLPRGVSRAEIERAFAGWQVIGDEPFDATGLPRPLRNVQPRCYRLHRL